MLSLLLALRIFLEISDVDVDDRLFLPVGVVLLLYTLTALFYTYRYREGLEADDATSGDVERERIQADLERERIATASAERQAELEAEARKKEAKALAKARKKEAKEASKAHKKAEKAKEKEDD